MGEYVLIALVKHESIELEATATLHGSVPFRFRRLSVTIVSSRPRVKLAAEDILHRGRLLNLPR